MLVCRFIRLGFVMSMLLFSWSCIFGQGLTPLGEGLKLQGYIRDIQFDAILNRVYVAGNFTAINNVKASNLAYLENGIWHAIDGIKGTIYSIELVGNDLYVGGYFEYANDQQVWGVAKYSGGQWTALGTGSNGSGTVSDLAWYDGQLYAAGTFANMGNAQITGVAKWDGHQWTDEGLVGALRESKFLVTGDTLWSYGVRNDAPDGKRYVLSYKTSNQWDKIAKLDGSSMNSAEVAIVHDHHLYILASNERIYKWDGMSWSEEFDIDGSEFLFSYKGELYVIAQNNSTDRLEIIGVENLTLIGSFSNSNRQFSIHCAVDLQDELWLGGYFQSFNGSLFPSLIKWSSNNWSSPGKVANTGYDSFNSYAYGETVFADSMFVGGSFLFAGNEYAPYVARWKDEAWHPVGDGLNNVVKGFVNFNNILYAGGYFTKSGEKGVKYLAQWNGLEWSQVGLGTNAPVYGFIIFNNKLHVYGAFTQIDGKNIYNFARLNGTTWEQVPGPWAEGETDEVLHVVQYNNTMIASTPDTYPIKVLTNSAWEEMSPDFYIGEGHLGVYNNEVYFAVDGEGLYKNTGSAWVLVAPITDIDYSYWGRVFTLENELFASFQNIGFLNYDGSELKNLHASFRPLSVSKIRDKVYFVSGFFENIPKADCNESVVYNHVGILDFNPPVLEIEIETPFPCTEEYVYLDINTTLLDYEVEWLIEGSIFGTSDLDCPILRYFEPGTYPITAIVHHAMGVDTIHATIVISDDCTTSVQDVVQNGEINVWPNPSSDFIQFTSHDELKSIVQVYDISGYRVYEKVLAPDAHEHTIDIADWQNGYYFILFKSAQKIQTAKFAKVTP